MEAHAVARRAGSTLLLAAIILGGGWLTIGRASSGRTTAASEVTNDTTMFKFSIKSLAKCPFQEGEFECHKGITLPNVINASSIFVSSDDEIRVEIGAQSGPFAFGENRDAVQAISLPVQIPVTQIEVFCQNEAVKCNGSVSVVGQFVPPPG